MLLTLALRSTANAALRILREVKEYAFYDIFQVGDRDYDTCLEMGDGDNVMDAMIAKAKRSKNLNAAAQGIYPLDRWNRYLNEGARSLR